METGWLLQDWRVGLFPLFPATKRTGEFFPSSSSTHVGTSMFQKFCLEPVILVQQDINCWWMVLLDY